MKFNYISAALLTIGVFFTAHLRASESKTIETPPECTVVLMNPATFETIDRIHAPTCDAAYKRCLFEIRHGLECYRQ